MLLLLGWASWLFPEKENKEEPREEWIEIFNLPEPAPLPQLPIAKTPAEEEPTAIELPPAPEAKEEAPEKARFAAERNQKVKKETIAQAPKAAPPAPPKEAPAATPPRAAPEAKDPGDGAGGNGLAGASAALLPGGKEPLGAPGSGEGTGQGKALTHNDLFDPNALKGAIGQSAMLDLKTGNVPLGQATLLNTKEEVFAGFLGRVRTAVAHAWDPVSACRLHDPTGEQLGFSDKSTTISVSLNLDGTLHSVFVTQPSGLRFLDDEAIRAFKEAGPFPNPPPQMADKEDNRIRFTFKFIVSVNTKPKIKLVAN